MKIIRSSVLSLNFATALKLQLLSSVLEEYKRIVNVYIGIFFNQKEGSSRFSRIKINTWLSARLQQCSAKQALQILKTCYKKDRDRRYKKYKKVFFYFKSRNRQLKFLNKRFSELKLKRKIKPIYKKDVIEFDERFVTIQQGENSFELWIKIGSIGNKIILFLPTNKHKHFNKFSNWERLKSTRLRKIRNKYYLDVFFEKEVPDYFTGSKNVGLDVGINKLISLSDERQLGIYFKQFLIKLNRRQQKSKRWRKTLTQVKNYIRKELNLLDLEDIQCLVLENLKYITIGTKQNKKVNKTTRKLLSKWNLGEFYLRLKNKCEFSRTKLVFVDPKFTSRTCHECGFIDKKSRDREYFQCVNCGFETNADINAAKNILERFYQQFIVTDS